MLFASITAWSLIVQDYSKGNTYALACIPWVVEFLGSTLNKEPERHGYSVRSNFFSLVFCSALIPGFLTETGTWYNLAILFGTLNWLVYSITSLFFPRFLAVTMWQIDPKQFEQKKFIYPMSGVSCVHCLVLVSALEIFRLEPVTAMAYAQVALAVGLLYPFALGSGEESFNKLKQRHLVMFLVSMMLAYFMIYGPVKDGGDEKASVESSSEA